MKTYKYYISLLTLDYIPTGEILGYFESESIELMYRKFEEYRKKYFYTNLIPKLHLYAKI